MKRSIAALALTTCLVFAGGALAQEKLEQSRQGRQPRRPVRSLPDIGGPGSVVRRANGGWKIDLISADHQNKPDVGVNIASNGSTSRRSMRLSTSPVRASASPLPISRRRRTSST